MAVGDPLGEAEVVGIGEFVGTFVPVGVQVLVADRRGVDVLDEVGVVTHVVPGVAVSVETAAVVKTSTTSTTGSAT